MAVLYQNDAFGEDLLNGFKDAIKGTQIKVVAEESYEVTDPTVSSQMSKLAGSDADVFLNISTPKFGAQAIAAQKKLGWKVLHIINNVSASKPLVLEPVGLENAQGLISTSYLQGPGRGLRVGRRPGGQGDEGGPRQVLAQGRSGGPLLHLRLGRGRDDDRGAQGHEGAHARGADGFGPQHGARGPDPAARDQGATKGPRTAPNQAVPNNKLQGGT